MTLFISYIKKSYNVFFVKNKSEEILVIFRRGKWDLPKGKAEKGESPEETALREVQEECGLHGIVIKGFLHSTYHVYTLNDKFILKKTDWFAMEYSGEKKPVPSTAEDITDVQWVKLAEMDKIFANTYPSVREIITGSL